MIELVLPLAVAQVNTKTGAVDVLRRVRVFDRLLRRGGGEARIDAREKVSLGVGQELCQVEVLNLGGEGRGELASVEIADTIHAALAVNLGLVERGDGMPQGGDGAHSGDHDSSAIS